MIAQAFFKVMAPQVRPGLTQPTRRQGTSEVRLIVQASTSKFHQGPQLTLHTRPDVWLQSLPVISELKESAWQNGASMYVAGHTDDPTLADALLDRIVHNAYHLDLSGDSLRKLKSIRARNEKMEVPQVSVRSRSPPLKVYRRSRPK